MTRCTVITAIVGLMAITAAPADAVVYCKTVGVPQGCVARPGAAGVGVTPGVGVGAPGVGVRAGTPGNRGGPVNRVGPR
jgi:hypothetical protein